MRKVLSFAAVAASAVAVVAAVAPAQAATGHVLTVGKAGGTAVKTGAVLKAGLAKGASVVFAAPAETLTCKSASFSAKVKTNPTKPGKATESQTSQSLSKCTVNVTGVTVKSVKVNNLPYDVTVSDSKGDPVTISGSSKSKPLSFTVSVSVTGVGTVTCTSTAASIKGTSSNKGNTITFTKQKFTSSGGLCGSGGTFSATFGPVKDTSVKGSPAVFVN
ncbi:MAG TPA: hypothetical protein VLX31_13205 [Streptosporangiaceae bacterium]|nr:hypothetical protein [Streptosporangiaceae bacterium]